MTEYSDQVCPHQRLVDLQTRFKEVVKEIHTHTVVDSLLDSDRAARFEGDVVQHFLQVAETYGEIARTLHRDGRGCRYHVRVSISHRITESP